MLALLRKTWKYTDCWTVASGDGSQRLVGETEKEGGGLCSDLLSKFLNCRNCFGNECNFL